MQKQGQRYIAPRPVSRPAGRAADSGSCHLQQALCHRCGATTSCERVVQAEPTIRKQSFSQEILTQNKQATKGSGYRKAQPASTHGTRHTVDRWAFTNTCAFSVLERQSWSGDGLWHEPHLGERGSSSRPGAVADDLGRQHPVWVRAHQQLRAVRRQRLEGGRPDQWCAGPRSNCAVCPSATPRSL